MIEYFKRAFPILSFILFFSAVAFFYVQLEEMLEPERLRAKIKAGIEDYIETSSVEFGSVDSDMGTSGEIIVKDLVISSKSGIPFIKTKNAKVKLPYYALLAGGGRIRIELNGLSLDYPEFVKHFDREKFLNGLKKKRFFDKSRLSFNITETNLKLGDTKESVLEIKKILLKNFSSKLKTAFEIDSPFVFKFSKNRRLNLELLAIGEFSLSELLQEESLKSSVFVKISGLKTVDQEKQSNGSEIREIHGSVDLTANSLLNVFGSIEFRGDDSYLTSNFDLKKKALELSQFQTKLNLDIMEKLGLFEVKNADLQKVQVTANGRAKISPDFGLSPSLKFSLSRPINYYFSGIPLSYKVEGEILPEKVDVKLESQLLEGQVSYDFVAKHNFKLHSMGPAQLEQGILDIEIRDVNLQKALLKNQTFHPLLESVVKKVKKPKFPVRRINFGINNVQIDNRDLVSKGYFLQKEKESSAELGLNYGEGELNLSFQNEQGKAELKADADSLDLKSLKPFLPTKTWGVQGTLSGSLQSFWKDDDDEWKEVNGKGNITFRDGELPTMTIADRFNRILSKLTGNTLGDAVDLSQYAQIGLGFQKTEKNINIERFSYLDKTKTLLIEGTGKISINKEGKSTLNLDIKDEKGIIWFDKTNKSLPRKIPLRLSGKKFNFEPDLFYTLNKLNQLKQGSSD